MFCSFQRLATLRYEILKPHHKVLHQTSMPIKNYIKYRRVVGHYWYRDVLYIIHVPFATKRYVISHCWKKWKDVKVLVCNLVISTSEYICPIISTLCVKETCIIWLHVTQKSIYITHLRNFHLLVTLSDAKPLLLGLPSQNIYCINERGIKREIRFGGS